jgi:hypothetical protein
MFSVRVAGEIQTFPRGLILPGSRGWGDQDRRRAREEPVDNLIELFALW